MHKMTITTIISIRVKPLWNVAPLPQPSPLEGEGEGGGESEFRRELSSKLRFRTLDFINLDFLFHILQSTICNPHLSSLQLREKCNHRINLIRIVHWIFYVNKNSFVSPVIRRQYTITNHIEITVHIKYFPLPLVARKP